MRIEWFRKPRPKTDQRPIWMLCPSINTETREAAFTKWLDYGYRVLALVHDDFTMDHPNFYAIKYDRYLGLAWAYDRLLEHLGGRTNLTVFGSDDRHPSEPESIARRRYHKAFPNGGGILQWGPPADRLTLPIMDEKARQRFPLPDIYYHTHCFYDVREVAGAVDLIEWVPEYDLYHFPTERSKHLRQVALREHRDQTRFERRKAQGFPR